MSGPWESPVTPVTPFIPTLAWLPGKSSRKCCQLQILHPENDGEICCFLDGCGEAMGTECPHTHKHTPDPKLQINNLSRKAMLTSVTHN
ncbi:hypothetical protein A6R68_14040 [Neotoma lepida]|uniref:Uncharacterized protein n=1 Tax=Neotoma lepida TaxID=56216 RepID=A0A1A6HCQ1_NEOLE|nr:hypothetical protein A6R68_14040 [Neotoma lepida]